MIFFRFFVRFFLRIKAQCVILCLPPEAAMKPPGTVFQTMNPANKTTLAVTVILVIEAILSIIYLLKELLR